MRAITSSGRSCLLITGIMLWRSFAAVDPYDSSVVRIILDKIGWSSVTVQSVVSSSIITIDNTKPVRVTNLNLAWRNGLKQVTELPPEIGQLPELTALSLRGNALSELPEEASTLHKLTRLDISSNRFTQLPGQLKELPLQVLIVDHNPLKSLPEWIGNLQGLGSASFVDDSLTEIPAAVARISGLATLNLDSNLLETIPEELTGLNTIRIGVAANRLCHIDAPLSSWLDSHQLGNDWRASQWCEASIASVVTDALTGTVINISADTSAKAANCLPLSVKPLDATSLASLDAAAGGQRILKAVEILFNKCFTLSSNYFVISFSWKDIDDSLLTPGGDLTVQYVSGNKLQYLGGTVDSVNRTVSVRTSREGKYALVLTGVCGTTLEQRKQRGPETTATRISWCKGAIEAFLDLERPSAVRFRIFSLDGRLMAERRMNAGAGANFLRVKCNDQWSQKRYIVEVLVAGARTVRLLQQNF